MDLSKKPQTVDGRHRVVAEKGNQSKSNFFSHNWCDKTTWYTMATRVVDETASDSGDHLTYDLANQYVIDTYHGKLFQEDYLLDGGGNSYRVQVKVDGVVKTEQDPHFGTGGDYTVDYANGKIVFLSALAGTETVLVTYHYATTSEFIFAPAANKKLNIVVAEVQFSDDVVLNDTTIFQPWVYNPYDPPNKVPYGNPVVYKTMDDFIAEAMKGYPSYPSLSASTWRGTQRPRVVCNWDYIEGTDLLSSVGLEVRLSLQHHTPHGGEYATASFYCRSEDE